MAQTWNWERKASRTVINDEKREAVLLWIEEFNKRGYSPTMAEIAEGNGILSKSTVHGMIEFFEKKGKIERLVDERGKLRGLVVL